MTQINWNALQSFDIGGAFNQGMQAGQQRRREQETDNALRALIANPNDTNVVNDLAKYDPGMAYKIQGQQQQQMRAQQEAQARQGAVRGDPQALEALAGFNMDDYIKLDDRSKQQYKQGIETIGQLALMADTPQEWDDTVRQLAQGAPEFQKYIGRFDLRESVIAQAGQAKEFIAQNAPDIRSITDGGSLIEVPKDGSQAKFIVDGRSGQQAAPPRVPKGPDAEDIAMLRKNPNAAAQFDEVFGPGAAQRALGGGGGNSTGNFPGQ